MVADRHPDTEAPGLGEYVREVGGAVDVVLELVDVHHDWMPP